MFLKFPGQSFNPILQVLKIDVKSGTLCRSDTIIFNPIRTRQNFSINGPGGDRFDTTNSNVNNSRTTNDKKSVFAPREAQFSDKKSKPLSLCLQL